MININKFLILSYHFKSVFRLISQQKFIKCKQQQMTISHHASFRDRYPSPSSQCTIKPLQFLNNNKYRFSTFSSNKLQQFQPFSNKQMLKMTEQEREVFQHMQMEKKKTSQDFSQFISQLQSMHQQDFSNYEQIVAIIDKYINEKILAYYLQTSASDENLVYFFQNPFLMQNYSAALSIKSSVEFRFRKYDQILTNIQNQLYLLKFTKTDHKMKNHVEKLCSMYIFILVLHDHNKLRHILKKDYTLVENFQTQKSHSDQIPKAKGRRVSRRSYQGPKQTTQEEFDDQKQTSKKKGNQTSLYRALKLYMNSENPQTILSRAEAYAVIGQPQRSLNQFCRLLNSDRRNKIYLGNFLSAYLFFANQNYVMSQGKGYSSENLKEFVKMCLTKEDEKLQMKILPGRISPEDAEYVLNSILSFIKDEPLEWTDLPNAEIKQFYHVIYLIAENYYLSGETEKGSKIIQELKTKVQEREIKLVETQRKGRRTAQRGKVATSLLSQINTKAVQSANIEMLITFFQLMRHYDRKQFAEIKNVEDKFTAQQKEMFYQFYSVPNDVLRSNIYQIFSQTYRQLNDNQKADEFEQLSYGNHCINNSYEINQMGDVNQAIEKPQDQPVDNKNKGVLPHYLNFSQRLKDFDVKFL